MSEYDVSKQDVEDAVRFVRDYLRVKKPDSDFSQNSVLSDVLIESHAYLFAYLKKQIANAVAMQSLKSLATLPDSQSVADSADALLSNLFLSRAYGTFAKGTATVTLSQRVDCTVTRTARLFRTRSNVFYLDQDTDLVVPANNLRPAIDATGTVTGWTLNIPITAARVGEDYNLGPGNFVAFDRFNPYLLRVETTSSCAGGSSVQSTRDFIEKAKDGLSMRALINARSNSALITNQFPEAQTVKSFGFGDPEMTRDLIATKGSNIKLHGGGKSDIYVRLQPQEFTEIHTVGETYPRTDGKVLTFKDALDPGETFTLAGVTPGDILVIAKGLPEAPFEYVVETVADYELGISPLAPFSVATDEAPTTTTFSYTIGNNFPAFDNKKIRTDVTTANTSRLLSRRNAIFISANPVTRIKSIELRTDNAALAPYKDPLRDALIFSDRVNHVPISSPEVGSPLKYNLEVLNPSEAQSTRAVTVVNFGWLAVDLSGATVEIVYEGLNGFATIDKYISSAQNRILAADTLLKGFYPIDISVTIPYRIRADAASMPDETAMARDLAEFIRAYRDNEVLDRGQLMSRVAAYSSSIGTVFPFTVRYTLAAPTGKLYRFTTEDRISIRVNQRQSVTLLNPTDFGFTGDLGIALENNLLSFGVTDNNVFYTATDGSISFERRV